MILLAMNKILGNLFFFSLSSDVQKKETFFRVYFLLSFGVHFNTSSVFSLFRVCFPRFFSGFTSLCYCVCTTAWMDVLLLLLLVSLSLLLPGCVGSCSARLFCSHQTRRRVKERGEDHSTQTVLHYPCEWLVLLFWSAPHTVVVGTNTSNSNFEGNFFFDRRSTS